MDRYKVEPRHFEGESLQGSLMRIYRTKAWLAMNLMVRPLNRKTSLLKGLKNRPGKPLLTQQESRILTMVASGYSDETIAKKLSISVPAVKSHKYQTYSKIGTNERLQAALWAVKYL